MRYYKNLYMSENLADKKDKIIRKLNQNGIMWNTYVIALAQGEQNHLEFFDSVLLQQKMIAGRDLFVVGIASGYDEALVLVEEIIKEVYDDTKGADIRSYILNKDSGL